MSALDLIARQTNRLAIRDLLCAQDCSIAEIVNESGIAYGTVRAFIKRHEKSGEVKCVSKTVRLNARFGLCAANGTIAARYVWDSGTRNEQAEALIYRLLDRLLDVPLDAGGLGLVKEAQQFIGWNAQ